MSEEKKERWLSYLALTTVILAVSATLSTFWGQRHSTRAVLNEIKASNQWSYYQAKKIRGYFFEVQKEAVETELLKLKEQTPEAPVVKKLEKQAEEFTKKIAKWDEDRDKIESDARKFEQTRDASLIHGQSFGVGVIFLQMAILLSSIAALMKKISIWIFGLIVGIVGVVYFANGFLLFM